METINQTRRTRCQRRPSGSWKTGNSEALVIAPQRSTKGAKSYLNFLRWFVILCGKIKAVHDGVADGFGELLGLA
jgi:hypothetical protein